jgi:hypothetical protein
MHIYRAYRLNKKRRITTGCWIEAHSDLEARRKAADLCEAGSATVEIWRGSDRIDEIDCSPRD